MDIIQTIVLSLVQGITEFLPISSSAHLILVPIFGGWQDQGLAFDVTVHCGTLVAVCHYFRKQLTTLTISGLQSLLGQHNSDSRLAWFIIISTIPAGLFGVLFDDWIEQNLRSTIVIATTTIIFALLLAYADRFRGNKDLYQLNSHHALFIGLMQALALIPGTSRSGITLTAALLIGMTRQAATKYCFLLAVPLILAASLLKTAELIQQPNPVDWFSFLLAFVLSAITAWLVIHLLLSFIEKIGVLPFVIYRLLLGIVLILLMDY
jgi:undecaprenyl-diphosphatase